MSQFFLRGDITSSILASSGWSHFVPVNSHFRPHVWTDDNPLIQNMPPVG